jgi:hypothetical protein
MGWANGSYLANSVWHAIEEYVLQDKRQEVARAIVDLFNKYDADDWQRDDGDVYTVAYLEE